MKLPIVTLSLALALGACGDVGGSQSNDSIAATPSAGVTEVPADSEVAASDAAPSEDAVKAWINDSVQGRVNGSSSEPQAITLEFQSVEIGSGRTTGEPQIVAGVRNDMFYPVTVHYTENDTFGDEVQHKQVGYQYWFYLDQSGHWNASGVGPV